MIDRDDVKLVNCADCGRPKVGLSMKAIPSEELRDGARQMILRLGFMAGYIAGRPYCQECFRWRQTGRRLGS